MDIKDTYLIYNPKAKTIKKDTSAKPLSLTGEVWQKELQPWVNFYQASDASFSPLTDEKTASSSKESETAQKPLENATKEVIPEEKALAIMKERNGKCLTKDRIIKPDHYPGLHNDDLQNEKNNQKKIEGAPNYRNVNGIHGTALPTVEGLKTVLDEAGAKKQKVKWINLREEPVIYIDGKPHSLRNINTPKKNLEDNSGITSSKLEEQERDLKKEILEEAKRNGNKIIIHEEDKNGKVVAREVEVTEKTVQTTEEVFKSMKKQGYKVDYNRVPVTDEKPPEKKDFDELTKVLKDTDPNTPVIFNCHAGRGRTTTGMVVADLIRRTKEEKLTKSITRNKAVRSEILEQGDNVDKKQKPAELRKILTLIKTLEEYTGGKTYHSQEEVDGALGGLADALTDGKDAKGDNKAKADDTIDRLGQVQNLRKSTLKELNKIKNGTPEEKDRSMQYLKRYFMLLSYQDYLKDEGKNGLKQPFSKWLDNNRELSGVLDKLQLALGLNPSGSAGEAAYG